MLPDETELSPAGANLPRLFFLPTDYAIPLKVGTPKIRPSQSASPFIG